MKHRIFCIHDVAAGCYLPPFVLHEPAMAIRAFGDCVNSDTHQFGKHPGDYTLFEVGSFDDASCLLVAWPGAKKLANGLELVVVEVPGAQGALELEVVS